MRKGQKLSEISRKKISLSLLGRRCCMRTEFKKGHTPFNKGTIGLMKPNKTSFKKGQIPANSRGGYKICKDGIYVLIGKKHYNYNNKIGKKFSIGKYENLARVKYREKYGDFPKEMVVFHKDNDIYNNQIENLELITRKELLKRNANIIKKKCSICGKEFKTINPYHKTCSKKCYKENCKLLYKKYHKKNKNNFKEYSKRYREKKKVLLLINEKTKSKDLNSISI
jgi:hypothetical protein